MQSGFVFHWGVLLRKDEEVENPMKKALYQVYEYTCDLCGYVWRPDYWANNANGGKCDIVEDGTNGKEFYIWEHLCRDCRKAIEDTVRAAVKTREGCRKPPEETPASKKWPPLDPGTKVKTSQPNYSLRGKWTNEAWDQRRWGMLGVIMTHSDSHGLCYEIRHEDGSVAWYDPSEMDVV